MESLFSCQVIFSHYDQRAGQPVVPGATVPVAQRPEKTGSAGQGGKKIADPSQEGGPGRQGAICSADNPDAHAHLAYCLPVPGMENGKIDQGEQMRAGEQKEGKEGKAMCNHLQINRQQMGKPDAGQPQDAQEQTAQNGKIDCQGHEPGRKGGGHELFCSIDFHRTRGKGRFTAQDKGFRKLRIITRKPETWNIFQPLPYSA